MNSRIIAILGTQLWQARLDSISHHQPSTIPTSPVADSMTTEAHVGRRTIKCSANDRTKRTKSTTSENNLVKIALEAHAETEREGDPVSCCRFLYNAPSTWRRPQQQKDMVQKGGYQTTPHRCRRLGFSGICALCHSAAHCGVCRHWFNCYDYCCCCCCCYGGAAVACNQDE